jgi:hypothetical protein
MSNETVTNGRMPRKSLASQLDRLDSILDGLAEALQGAVADAVREALAPAVGVAVRESALAVVQAVLANPELRPQLANSEVTEEVLVKQKKPMTGVIARVASVAKAVAHNCASKVRNWLGGLARTAAVALRLRRPLGLAVGVGVALGVGCYLAGPAIASALGGVAGFGASLTASALRGVRRSLRGAAGLPS